MFGHGIKLSNGIWFKLTQRKVLAARQEALHISRCSHKENNRRCALCLGIWSLYLDLAKWGITCRMWIIWEGVCVKKCTTLHLGKQWPYHKNLVWCKIEQRKDLIKEMHKELIHFSERTLEEVKSHYFWHNQTKLVRELVQVRIVNWVKIIDLWTEDLRNYKTQYLSLNSFINLLWIGWAPYLRPAMKTSTL